MGGVPSPGVPLSHCQVARYHGSQHLPVRWEPQDLPPNVHFSVIAMPRAAEDGDSSAEPWSSRPQLHSSASQAGSQPLGAGRWGPAGQCRGWELSQLSPLPMDHHPWDAAAVGIARCDGSQTGGQGMCRAAGPHICCFLRMRPSPRSYGLPGPSLKPKFTSNPANQQQGKLRWLSGCKTSMLRQSTGP